MYEGDIREGYLLLFAEGKACAYRFLYICDQLGGMRWKGEAVSFFLVASEKSFD